MATGTWAGVNTDHRRSRKLTSAVSAGTATETAPTTDLTYGANVTGVRSAMIVIEAASAQTLSGAGTLDLYVLDLDVGAWMPCYDSTGTAISLAVTASSKRRMAFSSVEFPNRQGSFCYIPNGVTVSGGASVIVWHICDTVYTP